MGLAPEIKLMYVYGIFIVTPARDHLTTVGEALALWATGYKLALLAICRPTDRTVASGVVGVVVVVVVVGICNRSQMRTSKCTYSIFGVCV